MGVDVCVFKGYGIAVFTKDLSKEVVQKFITLGAKRSKKLERGIDLNSNPWSNAVFNPKKTQVQTSLIPLFLDKENHFKIDESERKKALELFVKEYDIKEYHTNIEEIENGGDDYEDLKKFLEENPNSWIPGKYLVIYYG